MPNKTHRSKHLDGVPFSRSVDLSSRSEDDDEAHRKRFYHYLPLCLLVLLMLAPQPSILWMLVFHYYKTLHQPIWAGVHLLVIYTLIFLAFSSLIVCISRDPGPVKLESGDQASDSREVDLTEALMAPTEDDFSAPGRWCHKCWAPKPERAHHCSTCGRCVLKMDHHCPWLAHKCVGHRTYPAFVHFLGCITFLSIYVSIISIRAVIFSFSNPLVIDEVTPVHELLLAAAGLVFTVVIGSFFAYHLYLVSTNQTTLEAMSPFLLLKHIPPIPPTQDGRTFSDPPEEFQLSRNQRYLVRDAHRAIRLYDLGFRKNWGQVYGWKGKRQFFYRILCGGGCVGDGKRYPRNPRADELLARLTNELVEVDKSM